jgi:hypothetical protein
VEYTTGVTDETWEGEGTVQDAPVWRKRAPASKWDVVWVGLSLKRRGLLLFPGGGPPSGGRRPPPQQGRQGRPGQEGHPFQPARFFCVLASVWLNGRASDYGSEGCRFESCHGWFFGWQAVGAAHSGAAASFPRQDRRAFPRFSSSHQEAANPGAAFGRAEEKWDRGPFWKGVPPAPAACRGATLGKCGRPAPPPTLLYPAKERRL